MPNRRENEVLEQYLARLESYLSKLPANERVDALREVRQHLELLAENERTAGDKEAIQAAIARFGSAKRLARMFYYERFVSEWRRLRALLALLISILHPKYYSYIYIGMLITGILLTASYRAPIEPHLLERALLGTILGIVLGLGFVSARVRARRLEESCAGLAVPSSPDDPRRWAPKSWSRPALVAMVSFTSLLALLTHWPFLTGSTVMLVPLAVTALLTDHLLLPKDPIARAGSSK